MAKVMCPKCKQNGLVIEVDGLLACPREGCGYRGYQAEFQLGEGDVEKMLLAQSTPTDMNFSIKDEDVDVYLARVGRQTSEESVAVLRVLEPAVGADLPDEPVEAVVIDASEKRHLEIVSEAIYADFHRVLPGDLTVGSGREEAHKLIPFLAPLLERGFKAGWTVTGDGYNGEWPDEGREWADSEGYRAFLRWFEES